MRGAQRGSSMCYRRDVTVPLAICPFVQTHRVYVRQPQDPLWRSVIVTRRYTFPGVPTCHSGVRRLTPGEAVRVRTERGGGAFAQFSLEAKMALKNRVKNKTKTLCQYHQCTKLIK